MDWNWFFSSLSQSVAAIVGIFGAFIITKILSNQVSYSEKVNKYRDTLTKCRRVKDSASDLHFNWYNKHINNRQYEKLNELFEDEDYLAPESYYDKLNFSIFYPRESVIEEIKLCVMRHQEKRRRERKDLAERASKYAILNPGFSYVERVQPRIPIFSHLNTGSELQKEREAIDSVIRDARYHMRLASNMLDSVKGNPESSPQITYALVLVTLLFFIGVIYPLSFLPADPKGNFNLSFSAFLPLLFTIKGMFLMSLSLIFSAVLVMFFLLNFKLKYSDEVIQDLEQYAKISSYSENLSIMEINKRIGAASHDG